MVKIKIRKNDIVLVNSGNSKGEKGKVIKIYPKENKAMVEGVNMISKHTKPNAANPQGELLNKNLKYIFLILFWLTQSLVNQLRLEEERMKKQES